jgi:uronate dehydrogenase
MSVKPLAEQRVVMTGAAGRIGRVLRGGLAPQVGELVVSDRVTIDDLAPNERYTHAQLEDGEAIERLLTGADAVIHLGGVSDEASFDELEGPNLRGVFTVFEGARREGVQRVVYASSNHATGFYPTTAPLDGSEPLRPDGLYGATKAFAEGLGRMYVDRFGLECVAVRIGSFEERPSEPRHLYTWLSHGDALRLFTACLAAPAGLGFHVVYGVSANTQSWWPSARGDAHLGYAPRDDAEGLVEPATTPDRWQGGYATDPDHGGWATS